MLPPATAVCYCCSCCRLLLLYLLCRRGCVKRIQKSTKNRRQIGSKSSQNRPQIEQKLILNGTPARASNFHDFRLHFCPLLDPIWHHNRAQNGFENTSKIRYKKCIEKVSLCVVSGTLLDPIFDPKIAYFPNVFKALILKMVLTCFYNFFKRVEPQKSLKSCRKTRVFARVTSRSNCKENL